MTEKHQPIGDDMIIAPGGPKKRSIIHLIEKDHVLDASGTHYKKIHKSGRVVQEYDIAVIKSHELQNSGRCTPPTTTDPSQLPGWVTYSFNDRVPFDPSNFHVFTTLKSTWVVPDNPSILSDQLIYLFNGIQWPNIIQPVLQWGYSGQFWEIASWYVGSNFAFHTAPQRVNSGTVLTGMIDAILPPGLSANREIGPDRPVGTTNPPPPDFPILYSYIIQFMDYAQTALQVNDIVPPTECVHTLETYSNDNCSKYPSSPSTVFSNIEVRAGVPYPPNHPVISWQPVTCYSNCNEHCEITLNANPGGIVTLYYR